MDFLWFDYLGFILIIPITLYIIYLGKHLHKRENIYYLIVALIALGASIIAIVAQVVGFNLKENYPFFYAVFFQGHLSFALYVLVMFAGAFKHKSSPKLTLMRVRREMAILGFLFLVPHVVLLIWLALSNLNPTGTLAFLVMIPLFITSFKEIRKKMQPLKWRKLHKLAYIAYALIYIHIASITIIFNLLNNSGASLIPGFIRFGLYTLIFAFYTYLKFTNYVLIPKEPTKTA